MNNKCIHPLYSTPDAPNSTWYYKSFRLDNGKKKFLFFQKETQMYQYAIAKGLIRDYLCAAVLCKKRKKKPGKFVRFSKQVPFFLSLQEDPSDEENNLNKKK